MNGGLRTAVAVAATPALRRVIPRALAIAGIELLAMRADAASAMRTLHAHKPDLLICEAQLPMMEGRAPRLSRALHAGAAGSAPRRAAARRARSDAAPPRAGGSGRGDARARTARGAARGRASIAGAAVAALLYGGYPPADALLDALGVPAHRGRDCLRGGGAVLRLRRALHAQPQRNAVSSRGRTLRHGRRGGWSARCATPSALHGRATSLTISTRSLPIRSTPAGPAHMR